MTLTLFTVQTFNSLSYLNNQIVFIYSCPYIFIIHSICFLSPVTLIYFQSIIIPVSSSFLLVVGTLPSDVSDSKPTTGSK